VVRPHRAPHRALWGALLALWLATGCGAEGEAAPEPRGLVGSCPTLGARLAKTRAALGEDVGEGLRVAVEAAAARRDGDDVRALLDGVLAVVAELWRQLQDEGRTLPIAALDEALARAQPQLVAALRYLAAPGAAQAAAYDLIAGLLTACPSGSVTEALLLVLTDEALLSALGASLSDPTVLAIVGALPPGEGLAPLVRAVVRAINSPRFVFDDLVALIEPLFDLTQPPLDALLPPLRRLLSGEPLVTIRALTVCLEDAITTRAGQSGGEALGALLYGLLQAPGVELGALLGALEPALNLVQDPNTAGLLTAALQALRDDDRAREGLKPALLTLLSPAYGPGVLESLAALIEAGAVPEVLWALSDLLDPRCQMR
jgi:hypothetical protein